MLANAESFLDKQNQLRNVGNICNKVRVRDVHGNVEVVNYLCTVQTIA